MRIAIIAPSPVPFTIGGAEKLWWGLQNYVNSHTSHQCELIKIQTKENDFWNLIDSYIRYYKLNLEGFDLVISTKYPAWMVQHENHIVYMQHHLRGLFDTYHFFHLPINIPDQLITELVADICNIIDSGSFSNKNLEMLINLLDALKNRQKDYPPDLFLFPGPFIRKIVHFFDSFALSPNRIKRYCAISHNVISRKDYFPENVEISVIYHPSLIDNFQCNSFDYLFTISRLDSPKRIDLMIDALKNVPHDINLLIAGTGPEENQLKISAKNDKRIKFLGYLSEREIRELYSNALAVLYFPYDEDYGLITIEGMKSSKPVITLTDSGGSLEFVKNNETGLICDPNPHSISEKINYLLENRDLAPKMGINAHSIVQGISWENVASSLIYKDIPIFSKKTKILVLATYSCYPPQGGGQQRVYNLYSLIARNFDVTICSIIESNKLYQNNILKNGLKQVCIPQSHSHATVQWELERKTGVNLYDVAMIDHVELSQEYVTKVKEYLKDSDIVIFSHPYLYSLKSYLQKDQISIYEAHNMEYLLKKDYVKDKQLLERIFTIENNACIETDLTLVTSYEDKENIIKYYNSNPDNIFVIPNGVDTTSIQNIPTQMKKEQKKIVGLPSVPIILFVGSWHPPNLEALEFVVDNLIPKRKDCLFMVIGSVCDYYYHESGKLPRKILAFGTVSEEEKYELYKLADIAINPMFSGSGTNLKMLDYMSAGIPVITTIVGARGIEIENYKHAIVCPAEEISDKIVELYNNEKLQDTLKQNGRNLVEKKYSWNTIANNFDQTLRDYV